MKQVHANYTFVASTKTITLTGLNIAQDQLLLVTNATRGVIYYNFASSSHRAVVTAGANTTVVLTDASTTGHADSDQLTIHYDDQLSTQTIAGTVTATIREGEDAIINDPVSGYTSVRAQSHWYSDSAGELKVTSENNPFPISGNVTIGSLPYTTTITGVGANFGQGGGLAGSTVTAVPVILSSNGNNGGSLMSYDGTNTSLNVNIKGTIPNITVGNSVTIGSLPAISGTVTVGMLTAENSTNSFPNQNPPVQLKANNLDGALRVRMDYVGGALSDQSVLSYKSTNTGDLGSVVTYAYLRTHVNNSVTIGSLPTISGTVTANLAQGLVSETDDVGSQAPRLVAGVFDANGMQFGDTKPFPISGTVTVGNSVTIGSLPAISGTVTARLQDASGNNLTSTSIGGVQRLNVSLASAATPGGTLPSFVNVYGGSDGSAVRTISVDSSGRQNTNAQFPRVTLIDGSGTVTTANTAITVFASSSTRSYLLVQVTTGSAFVNVGATATTVNGINLTAGQGYAWETTIPQGVVSLISTTTSSRYVAKEA